MGRRLSLEDLEALETLTIPRVTREYMESAVQELWREDFFEHLKRLEPSEHNIADLDSGEHR